MMPSGRRLGRKYVQSGVHDALTELVKRDRVLLELSAHELALTHRFGVYLEAVLQPRLDQRGLSVDLDYDRHGWTDKQLPERPDREGSRRFRPDLIVHRRTDDSENVLVVEWKKQANAHILDLLRDRLMCLVLGDELFGHYQYELGVMVDSSNEAVRWCALDRRGAFSAWKTISAS